MEKNITIDIKLQFIVANLVGQKLGVFLLIGLNYQSTCNDCKPTNKGSVPKTIIKPFNTKILLVEFIVLRGDFA